MPRPPSLPQKLKRDSPSGPVIKNPPSNTENVGFIPDQRTRIPPAAGQLSSPATTRELACCNNFRACPETTCSRALGQQLKKASELQSKYSAQAKKNQRKI